jgi:uncharacterized integral membrane protein
MKLSRLITIPIALLVIAFAIANRHRVQLSFDPFSAEAPALAITLPLWAIAFGAFVGGVIVGGVTAWITRLSQHLRRNWVRRAATRAEKAAARAHAQDPLADLPAITPRPAPQLPAPRRSLLRRLTQPNRAAG